MRSEGVRWQEMRLGGSCRLSECSRRLQRVLIIARLRSACCVHKMHRERVALTHEPAWTGSRKTHRNMLVNGRKRTQNALTKAREHSEGTQSEARPNSDMNEASSTHRMHENALSVHGRTKNLRTNPYRLGNNVKSTPECTQKV
jgi:HKD family nuclease